MAVVLTLLLVDLSSTLARSQIGDEHTLNMKGGAFWNMLGSMTEIQVPLFVLINVLTKSFSPVDGRVNRPDLLERIKKTITKAAGDFQKLMKGPKPPEIPPSYKVQVLGSESLDSRGFLPLEKFLDLALKDFQAQKIHDGKVLQAIYEQWEKGAGGASFDVFA